VRPGPQELAPPLLAWFAEHARPLPWRTAGPSPAIGTASGPARDPYRTWLSEVLAQQTRLEVVVPRYGQFLRRFPSLPALAEAPLDEVLAAFSGLGYYARARNLHAAARLALERHGGLPTTYDALRALPGLGPYTAAAVASLAFGEQVALVDGNVARVLARIFRLPGDSQAVRKEAWALAPTLLPEGRAGSFNEALMELGALVCTPRSPGCAACPLRAACGAAQGGDADAFPAAKARKVRPVLLRAALFVRRPDGRVLLERQPEGSLFAGLWDLPFAPLRSAGGARAASATVAASLLPAGVRLANPPRRIGAVQATLTHRLLDVQLFAAEAARGARTPRPYRERLRWVDPTEEALAGLGLSSLARRELAACLEEASARSPAPRGARRPGRGPAPSPP
jgi:A/G-specific adenine glycosylase